MTRRRRVLVVEDDPGIRHMLGMAIEALGDEARLADGRGPIDANGIDAAILDVRLGDRSAIDLLRAQPELRGVPLIVASAGEPGAARRLLPDAVVLQKPFDLDTLEEALAEATATGSTQA